MKSATKKVLLSDQENRLVHIMQLLGDSTRYKIFKLLMSEQELCVSDIAHRLDISVSAVSQHFKSFEMMGLVGKERMGQKICYSVKADDEVIKTLAKITK